jgi:hypothetical protein
MTNAKTPSTTRRPQTNGMVERFNGRISEVVSKTRFASAAELEATLNSYVKTYNHQIPQKAFNHLAPVQALKNWHKKNLELFKKQVYNQPGLDTYDGITRGTANASAPMPSRSHMPRAANGGAGLRA